MKNRMEGRTEEDWSRWSSWPRGSCPAALKGDSKGERKRRKRGVTNDGYRDRGQRALSLSPSGSRIIESYDCGREILLDAAFVFSPPQKLAKGKVCG